MCVRPRAAAIGLSIVVVFLGGCENSSAPPDRYNRNLGDSGSALPTVATVADVGILRDQKTYKAADIKGRVNAGDTTSQVKAFIEELMTALGAGDVDAMLEKFNPEDIAPLQDSQETQDELYNTFSDMRGALETAISSKLGPEVVAQINEREMLSFRDVVSIEIHSATSASVTPPLPLRRILGPAAPDVIAVEKAGGQWLIQLEHPLTDAELESIRSFQQSVQSAVDKLIEMINNDQATTADQIRKARDMAMNGEPPDLKAEPDEAGGGGEVQP